MASMAYKTTNFMVFINFAMVIVNLVIAPLIFPTNTPNIPTTSGIDTAISYISNNMLIVFTLGGGLLALFAFSLLVPTLPFIILFYTLNSVIFQSYIWQLGMPASFNVAFSAGITIITFMGIAEYAARQKV